MIFLQTHIFSASHERLFSQYLDSALYIYIHITFSARKPHNKMHSVLYYNWPGFITVRISKLVPLQNDKSVKVAIIDTF